MCGDAHEKGSKYEEYFRLRVLQGSRKTRNATKISILRCLGFISSPLRSGLMSR